MRGALVVVGSVSALVSCTSYYPVRSEEPLAPRSAVTVTFASPRDLEAAYEARMYALPAVEKVYGRIDRATTDTLVLRGFVVESRQRQPELPRAARLTVVPDAGTQVAIRRRSRSKTAALLGGISLIAIFAIAVVSSLDLSSGSPGY